MRGQATLGESRPENTTWAQRRNYDVFLGINVDEQEAVLEGVHEIQYWENARGMPPIASEEEIYVILSAGVRQRSKSRMLPAGVPEFTTNLEVRAFIHFASALHDRT
jgi:hypothetical protein